MLKRSLILLKRSLMLILPAFVSCVLLFKLEVTILVVSILYLFSTGRNICGTFDALSSRTSQN